MNLVSYKKFNFLLYYIKLRFRNKFSNTSDFIIHYMKKFVFTRNTNICENYRNHTIQIKQPWKKRDNQSIEIREIKDMQKVNTFLLRKK